MASVIHRFDRYTPRSETLRERRVAARMLRHPMDKDHDRAGGPLRQPSLSEKF